MPHKLSPRRPDPVFEPADFRPIGKSHVNFARGALPPPDNAYATTSAENVHTHSLQGYDRTQPAHINARIDAPSSATTTSFNWWPYPPWGQSASTVSGTSSETATSLSPPAVAAVSIGSSVSATTASAATPSLNDTTSTATANSSVPVRGIPVLSIAALPPATSLPSRPKVDSTAHSGFKLLYLTPLFILAGILLGALFGLLGYRWYSRRLARKGGNGDGSRRATFIPGPPYVPMHDMGHNAGDMQEASLMALGSPSKYTRHGAATKAWLLSVTGSSSHRASTRSTAPPSRESTTSTVISSDPRPLSVSPTHARSRGRAISPVSLSDEEIGRHGPTRSTSVRRKILERLQRVSDRSARSVSRDPSRRTAKTYQSSGSAYSGTHLGDSRAPSVVPSSSPTLRDTNTEWVPGSGFRIVEEAISSPFPPSTTDLSPVSESDLPGQTNAWDSDEALRQAVDAHPGERWLAWTRSWATASPPTPIDEDRFTVVPPRRAAQEKKDAEMLLRTPTHVTSSSLHSTLTFSPPSLAGPTGSQSPDRPPLPERVAARAGVSDNKRTSKCQQHARDRDRGRDRDRNRDLC
ncbi:hypothetical protein BC827DRAFT_195436 [Russula dissimulans]|nr:hypothetical protein BC827DRAFT_195436 [Russula dissimulans]